MRKPKSRGNHNNPLSLPVSEKSVSPPRRECAPQLFAHRNSLPDASAFGTPVRKPRRVRRRRRRIILNPFFPAAMRPRTHTASDHLPGASDLDAPRRRPDILRIVGVEKTPLAKRASKTAKPFRAGGIHFRRAFQSEGLPRGRRPRGNCACAIPSELLSCTPSGPAPR